MSSINIKETIKDKDTWFNVKRLNVQGLNENFSVKTLDLNNISKDMIEGYSSLKNKSFIFEKSKLIKDPTAIGDIIRETDKTRIKSFFGWRRWLDDKFWINTLTLQFNPYSHFKKFDEMEGFFGYFYEFSKRFVFVPNIRKFKRIYNPQNPSQSSSVEILDIDDYIKFVDDSFDFFSHKNNKPIFVPISINFSIDEIEKLVNYYIKKEHFYYWIDFESNPIDEVQTARVKRINHLIEKLGYFGDSLSLFTNVKREIISKRKEEKSPASDVLGTIYGANIVGIDRDPQRPIITKNQPPKEDIFEHKAREFDEKSYYYVKTKNKEFLTKQTNVTNNALKLSNEFEKQKQHFLEKLEVEKYLRTKEMINIFSNGRILIDIKKAFNPIQRRLDLI